MNGPIQTPPTQTLPTMCPMNCDPTQCGMLVDVQDGKLLGVRGDKDNPDSQGFLCVRGQASRQILDNPKRILKPMIIFEHEIVKDDWLIWPIESCDTQEEKDNDE